jgi:mono/diheme cytochrome c family protein
MVLGNGRMRRLKARVSDKRCLIELCAPCWVLLVLALVAVHAARADVQKGAQLARQWCANCHVIESNPAGTVPQGPPSFPAISRSGMTADQLRAFLSHPHGAMPDLALTRAEIDDLIGYIETFR